MKRYHSDGVKELSQGQIRKIIEGQGQTTTTIPNAREINGQAERSIQTIPFADRAALRPAKLLDAFWDYALQDAPDKDNCMPHEDHTKVPKRLIFSSI